ncbi:ATP cone domain-containing protein [Flavobacterium sp. NRK F10]|uniref:ATP cone domain-containing protein n=1 Tax=Flavobacterium sp. NRK F10 TaxID=2954931 RepID=UPI002090338A|nr:ATP cone domain-containing protein [Flavobacterium sp. NRK F10]MCO6175326.1 ATP cone domain-containing protein [Flavobacterium sp. NRK F10]
MKIKKYSGEEVQFDQEKLIRSLMASGTTREIALEVINEITPKLYEGISSRKIFRLAFQRLKNRSKATAARYNLKSGIKALGPAGFYFEKFIARIFELEGYQARTNVFVEGSCISHELDVVIKNGNHVAMAECKFHSNQEIKTDVKVPMYILSRFNDVNQKRYDFFSGGSDMISKCWLVTNNKFTTDALDFANCVGLFLMSWDYPEGESLRDRINKFNVYPITCLTTLTMAEKEILLMQDVLTVYDLMHFGKAFSVLKLSQSRMKNVKQECTQLLNR